MRYQQYGDNGFDVGSNSSGRLHTTANTNLVVITPSITAGRRCLWNPVSRMEKEDDSDDDLETETETGPERARIMKARFG